MLRVKNHYIRSPGDELRIVLAVDTTMSWCPACALDKLDDDFSHYKSRKRASYCKEYQKVRQHKAHVERRYRVLSHYSGGEPACSCCGEKALEFLTIDHVDKNGTKLRNADNNHRYITYWLERFGYPPGFRVLCMNCNHAFGPSVATAIVRTNVPAKFLTACKLHRRMISMHR